MLRTALTFVGAPRAGFAQAMTAFFPAAGEERSGQLSMKFRSSTSLFEVVAGAHLPSRVLRVLRVLRLS